MAGAIAWLAAGTAAFAMPSFEEVRQGYQRSDAVLLDREGVVLQQRRVIHEGRRVEWVPLGEISSAAREAILKAEDQRFYQHTGVDWLALGSALWDGLTTGSPRGASTISMQVSAFLDQHLRPRETRKTFQQKWEQIQAARELEHTWSKGQILEAYVNLVSFRGELQGIRSASRGLFDKDPHGLTQTEGLILAALLRAPNASPDRVASRACMLARSLAWTIPCDPLRRQVSAVLASQNPIRPRERLAPHVAQQLLNPARAQGGSDPLTVRSTLDARLQRAVNDTLTAHLLAVRSQHVQDAAVLVVDNQSGDILAYVGSSGSLSTAALVDGVRAKRQAGSTLKPFVYALALDRRLLTPASLLNDSPLEIAVTTGVYRPRNYDRQFHGLVSVRTALGSSLNVPAVRTAELVGLDALLSMLQQLGFDGLQESGEFYGPSLALGSADVTLWTLVNAYRTLANDGRWSDMTLIPDRPAAPFRQVISREAAFLVSDILSDRAARRETFGLESVLASRFWSAVKTGTSKDMRDNWCVGYSRRYTVGVWVGNFSAEPMWNVSGVTGAAPIWADVMAWLHRAESSHPKRPPRGVVSVPAAGSAGSNSERVDPGGVEWFIRGTEPNQGAATPHHMTDRILYPVHGAVVALDPDMPPDQQRMFFQVTPGHRQSVLKVDGQMLGPAGDIQLWVPQPGVHEAALVDQHGRVVDAVRFQVKGSAGEQSTQAESF
jgi:penicillin-binding protein 1C